MSMSSAIANRSLARLTSAAMAGFLPPAEPVWPTRILVCADDSASTGDALTAAKALARRAGAGVDVLAVFAPNVPVPDVPEKQGSARCEQHDRCAAADLIRAVRSEERQRFDGHAPWPVQLEVGSPVRLVLQNTQRTRADLVVIGMGSRDPLTRHGGISIPVCVARYTEVPMLAAAPALTALPQKAVLLVDREAPDPALLRAAVRSVDGAAVIWVMIYSGTTTHGSDGVKHDKETLASILQLVRREAVVVSKRILVRAVYRAGDPADALLSLARELGADLIVTPVHGAAGDVRSLVSNCADQLLLTAPCSVLIVPTE